MDAPPPSPALERALAGLRATRTRRPARVVAGVAASSLACAALMAWALGVRPDLREQALFPFVVYGASCLATFLALLRCALAPPRGQVLPSAAVAVRLAPLMVGSLVSIDLFVALAAPGGRALAAAHGARQVLAAGVPCLLSALAVAAVPVALGLRALRRLLPVGGWRVLMALGGAAGALSGLVLHLHCPVEEAAHVGLVHGAVLVLPALILALATVRRLSGRVPRDMSDGDTGHGS